jgi:5-methylcytosine-specific restriction endonuclease McrA
VNAAERARANYRASAKGKATQKAYKESRKREKTCAQCGQTFRSDRARFCSMACVGKSQRKPYSTDLVPVGVDAFPRTDRQKCAARRLAWAARGTRSNRGVWVAGSCRRCGGGFTCLLTNSLPQYCSLICRRLDAKARRRALKRGAHVGVVYRKKIFERDGWRCQLCKRKVNPRAAVPHPLAPTLDHIVPLADGGTHEPSNVQCAHFICNSRKGDRGASQQLMLFG